MPISTAAVSTKTLKVEPGWRRACATRLNWLPVRPGVTAVIARMAPVAGLIDTTVEAELPRVLGEVRLGRGLDPVGVVAVVDLVHVLGQDPALRPAAAELDREAGLLQLALEGPLLRDVEVADELLGDR